MAATPRFPRHCCAATVSSSTPSIDHSSHACSAGLDAKGHCYLDMKAAHAIQAAREDVEEAALRAAFEALPHESLYERGVGSRLGLNGRTLRIVRGGLPRRFSLEGGTLL